MSCTGWTLFAVFIAYVGLTLRRLLFVKQYCVISVLCEIILYFSSVLWQCDNVWVRLDVWLCCISLSNVWPVTMHVSMFWLFSCCRPLGARLQHVQEPSWWSLWLRWCQCHETTWVWVEFWVFYVASIAFNFLFVSIFVLPVELSVSNISRFCMIFLLLCHNLCHLLYSIYC